MQNSLSKNTSNWQIAGASSIGKSHLDSGLPNQDRLFMYQDSDICVAVVCDGAGSAKMSEQGSQYFSQAVGNFLVKTGKEISKEFKFDKEDWLSYAIIDSDLSKIRERLVKQLNDKHTLKDYHTTLTAIFVHHAMPQAVLIQIGDSPLLTSQFDVKNQRLDYFENLQIFGEDSTTEYVNETHFITQDNWQDFLQIEWIDTQNVDMIALMSDGCGDLVLAGGTSPRQVYRPFFGNLVFNLLQTQDRTTADSIIQTTLDNPATYRLTGDDKTLIVLLKNPPQAYQNLEPFLDNSENLTQGNLSQTPSASVWQMPVSNLTENNQENVTESTLLIDKATGVENTVLPETALPPILPSSVENVINRHEMNANPQALPQPVPTDTPNATKKLALVGVGSVIAVGIATTAWLMRSESTTNNSTQETQTVPPTTVASGLNATLAPMSATLPNPISAPISTSISTATAVANMTTASSATASQR